MTCNLLLDTLAKNILLREFFMRVLFIMSTQNIFLRQTEAWLLLLVTTNCITASCGLPFDLAAPKNRELCHLSLVSAPEPGTCIPPTVLTVVSFRWFISYPNHGRLVVTL